MLLSNKAVQKTKKTQEKISAVKGKIWKTTGREADSLWSKWNAFVKFMKKPPET